MKKMNVYDIVLTALMAAVIFATTLFLSFKIPTPAGQTMVKTANAFIILAGLLFGGWRGGLAAGIGSMLYDFTDPNYVAESYFTFIRFFLMGWLAGTISWFGGHQGKNPVQNMAAAVIASVFSTVLYIGKGIVVMVLGGSAWMPAMIAQSTKLFTSTFNIVIAVVISMVLLPILRKAFERAGIYQQIS